MQYIVHPKFFPFGIPLGSPSNNKRMYYKIYAAYYQKLLKEII